MKFIRDNLFTEIQFDQRVEIPVSRARTTRDDVLDALENESIAILRETAAAFRRPVLMHSFGNESSVLLHLARKAFHPAALPFPCLHVDS